MKLEAVNKPLRLLLPDPDREVLLQPGQPMDLPPRIAWKLLRQAKGKVRLVGNPDADWLTLWRLVAESSSGLEASDPRLPEVMTAIGTCDNAFIAGDKAAFLTGVGAVMQTMEKSSGSSAKGTSGTS